MDKLVIFIGRVAIATVFVEFALITDEWRKKAKIETEKASLGYEDDLADRINDIEDRLANLEMPDILK